MTAGERSAYAPPSEKRLTSSAVDQPLAREPDPVAVLERVPLSSHLHVVVLVVDNSRGALGLVRHQGRQSRGMRGLALLPAEPATHPLGDAHDLVQLEAQELGDDVLHFTRVLRRRIHDQRVVLTGWTSAACYSR